MKHIGLWGSPGSGKSSFLSALSIAVAQSRSGWTLVGVDDDSVDFLTRSTAILTNERRFPPSTEALEELGWLLLGQSEVRTPGTWRKRGQVTVVPSELHIDVMDTPGFNFSSTTDEEPETQGGGMDLFDDEPHDEPAAADDNRTDEERLVEWLAACDGIVYLFDPVRELKHGDAFHYFQRTLARIAKLSRESGRMKGNKLPHHLAVCVTKLDDPRVFEVAKKKGYLTLDTDDERMFPRVDPEHAESLFQVLSRVGANGNATLVRDTIDAFFERDRVQYFASSSVGFYLHRALRFRTNDYQNVVGEGYNARIRGGVNPINVLEPLLWLGEQSTKTESL